MAEVGTLPESLLLEQRYELAGAELYNKGRHHGWSAIHEGDSNFTDVALVPIDRHGFLVSGRELVVAGKNKLLGTAEKLGNLEWFIGGFSTILALEEGREADDREVSLLAASTNLAWRSDEATGLLSRAVNTRGKYLGEHETSSSYTTDAIEHAISAIDAQRQLDIAKKNFKSDLRSLIEYRSETK